MRFLRSTAAVAAIAGVLFAMPAYSASDPQIQSVDNFNDTQLPAGVAAVPYSLEYVAQEIAAAPRMNLTPVHSGGTATMIDTRATSAPEVASPDRAFSTRQFLGIGLLALLATALVVGFPPPVNYRPWRPEPS